MQYLLKTNKILLLVTFQLCALTVYSQDILWEKSYGGKHAEFLFDAIATPDYGFILDDRSISNKSRDKKGQIGGKDFWVVKLKNTSKEEIEAVLGVFPNPTVNATNVAISYNYDYGTATLYDLNGRQLQSIELKGEKAIPFNLGDLPQGMYLINSPYVEIA